MVLGLARADPETVDPVEFDLDSDIALRLDRLNFHSNRMLFEAFGADGVVFDRRVYFSVGGGSVLDEDEAAAPAVDDSEVPYPFTTARELVALAVDRGCSIVAVMADNERALGRHSDLRAGVLRIWQAMRDCVSAGLAHGGVLPGGLQVKRRAGQLAAQLEATPDDPLYALDWTTVYSRAAGW